MNSHEEHINEGESHDAAHCPGPDQCACRRGLERILRLLDSGEATFTQVDE